MGRGIAKQRKTLAAAASVLLALLVGTAIAQAGGVSQKGDLQVSFEGGIRPSTLPRSKPSPVTVEMSGSIKTTDKSVPPRLNRISLQINSHGHLSSKGLPTCNLAAISTGTGSTAKRVCGGALIGHGNVTSRIAFPSQEPFLSIGGMLAFNGTYHGRPAIFAQVSSQTPLSLTYVIVFEVKKTHGTFGTALDATLPPIASGYGEISSFYMTLGRKFSSHGHSESYASADCPAPKGINQVGFNLAKATYEFEGGVTMSNELNKTCKAKG
jgi:hypothetical protein